MDKEAVFDRYQDGMRQYIPAHMHGGVHRYVTHGIRPGNFLYLLLTGREADAFRSADKLNGERSKEWHLFLAGFLPPECHGSVEKVEAWIECRGLDGMT